MLFTAPYLNNGLVLFLFILNPLDTQTLFWLVKQFSDRLRDAENFVTRQNKVGERVTVLTKITCFIGNAGFAFVVAWHCGQGYRPSMTDWLSLWLKTAKRKKKLYKKKALTTQILIECYGILRVTYFVR